MDKISKASAGFQYHPETEFRCFECVFIKPLGTAEFSRENEFAAGCAFFGPADPISPRKGSCIYFSHGDSTKLIIPWLNLFTKEQLGYTENRQGFSCKRCEYISFEDQDCSKVDKDSPGDAPGAILAGTCCDLWEPDKERAKMTTPALLNMIAKLDMKNPKKATDFEEYQERRKAQK